MPPSDDMRLVQQQRNAAGNADLYKSNNVELINVDGIAGMGMGPGLVKVDLFRATDNILTDGVLVERREIRQTLVMPTLSFLEFITNTFGTIIENKQALSDNMLQAVARLDAVVQDIKNKA